LAKRKEKRALRITKLGMNTFFPPSVAAKWQSLPTWKDQSGPWGPVKIQGARMQMSGLVFSGIFVFVFSYIQEMELNCPSELYQTFDPFPPGLTLKMSFCTVIPLRILLLKPNL
jgi:hypothetical protein